MRIEPVTSLRGALAVPGDKSVSHRAVMLGALAEGETVARGFGASQDTLSTVGAMRSLGADVRVDGSTVRISGVGLRGLREPDGPVDCGNAGTLMRLLAGILAGQAGRFTLIGDESLSVRPLERVAAPLRLMGARIGTTDGHAPLVVEGGPLAPIRYESPVASAQVKSCVLLAGLLAEDGPTSVVEPGPSRDHTERMLRAAGARIEVRGAEIGVWPAARLAPLDLDVPGDFSSAAPFLAAGSLLAGSDVVLQGIGVNPTRIGFLHVLERMGARVAVFNRRTEGGEPVADLQVSAAELTATEISRDEVPLLIDELPLFALVASMARGESVVSGAAELRVKETDRIDAVTAALRAVGAHVQATPDGFRVRGVPARLRGGVVDSAGDHRIAMVGALAGLLSREGVEVRGAEWVAVSFPAFYDVLRKLAEG